MRWWASLTALLVAFAVPASAAPDCRALLDNLDALMGEYYAAGERAIEKDDPAVALEKARKRALKGEAEATVTMIGVGAALRGRKAPPNVAMIRQVCTFSTKNNHPLHAVACAYFNALNPIGERDVKRKAALEAVARFDRITQSGAVPEHYRTHIAALQACLPAD